MSISHQSRPTPRTWLIVVGYRAPEQVKSFVARLHDVKERDRVAVAAVCNECRRPEDSGAQWDEHTEWLLLRQNLGYFGGASLAYRRLSERLPLPDWVVVSNDDIEFHDSSFFQRLHALRPRPEIGALAPRIYSGITGLDQNPFLLSAPSWGKLLVLYLASYHHQAFRLLRRLHDGARQRRKQRKILAVSGQSIYAPHGSLMVLNRSFFERGGTLEYPGFLFGEEFFVAEQLRQLGLVVTYEPGLTAFHKEHYHIGKSLSPLLCQYFHESYGLLLSHRRDPLRSPLLSGCRKPGCAPHLEEA